MTPENVNTVTGETHQPADLGAGVVVDPFTGATTREQEYALEDPRGTEQLGYRDSSPVTAGEENEPVLGGTLGQDYLLRPNTAQDHQDVIPVRYEQGESYAESSETGVIGGVDLTPTGPRVEPKFNTQLHEAVPTFERAATSHNTRLLLVGVGSTPLVLRRAGRKYLVVSCPTTFTNFAGLTSTPLGFQVADDRAVIEAGQGYQVNPGDSLEIDTEGPVFVGPLPTQTSGFVQYSEVYSVPGGPVGM